MNLKLPTLAAAILATVIASKRDGGMYSIATFWSWWYVQTSRRDSNVRGGL